MVVKDVMFHCSVSSVRAVFSTGVSPGHTKVLPNCDWTVNI